MRALSFFVSLAVSLCCADAARAIDYSKINPPAEVADGIVAVGSRAVKLPPGNWTFVSYVRSNYSIPSKFIEVPLHTGYFANVRDGRFHLGFVLELPEYSFHMTAWTNDSCNVQGEVFKSTLDSNALFPECIIVNRRNALHRNTTGSFYPPVTAWLEQQKVDQSIPIYDIWYMHYSRIGQGRIRLFVPVSMFHDQQAAIDWAKKLPSEFEAFFQGRSGTATLSSLP